MSDAELISPAAGAVWRIEKPKLLLVEGIDEVRLFGALAKDIGVEDVQIRDYQGKDNLRRFLRVIPQIPGYPELESIAVTRDADENGDRAAESVRDALAAAALPVPDSPLEPAGDGRISVRYLIIPHGESGAL